MTALLSSGVYVEEEAPQVRALQGSATSILAAVGITERGPFDATLVTSYQEYLRLFGGHIAAGTLSLALQAFFENGGQAAYVKRVVHYGDHSDATTRASARATLTLQTGAGAPVAGSTQSGPGAFAVSDGQTLTVTIDGGAPATLTFNGAPATLSSQDGPFALADDQTLEVQVDGGAAQVVTFDDTEFGDITAATAAEVAASLSSKLTGAVAVVDGQKVRLESQRRGAGARIQVSGGTAQGALGLPGTEASGTGNVQNLAAVTVGEAIALLTPLVSGGAVTNQTGRLRVASSSTGVGSSVAIGGTARTAFGFDALTHVGGAGAATDALIVRGKTDGAYANRLSVVIAPATSGRTGEFNLLVIDDSGVVRERYANLSTDPESEAYYPSIINHRRTGSERIEVEAQGAGNLVPQPGTFGPLTGGDDGLTGLTDGDFIGSAVTKTGLHGFDVPDDASLLIVPDRQTPLVQVGMLQYATSFKKGQLFCILSAPSGQNVQEVRTWVEDTVGLYNLSEYGAFYYPHLRILNPNKAVFGPDDLITVPPDGQVAGAFARQDIARPGGIYEAPAGLERGQLFNVAGLESTYTQEESNRDLLYPSRINPIRLIGGVPVIDGVRTLKGNGNFPTVAERRGVIYIERTIQQGTEYARFRNNDADLRAELTRTITAFLVSQMNLGAFRSKDKRSAFFVEITEALNPPSVVFQGCVIGRVGLATQKPAEFIIYKFSQDTRALNAELSAGG